MAQTWEVVGETPIAASTGGWEVTGETPIAPAEDRYTIGNPMGDAAPVTPAAPPGPPEAGWSVTGARDAVQAADTGFLNWIKPGPNAGPGEKTLRQAAAVLPHFALQALQVPLNALIGYGQGPQGALTINPETGTLGLTPEAQAAGLLHAGGIRFSGRNPLSPAAIPTGSLERPAPLSPEFRAAPIAPEVPQRMVPEPGPSSPTGLGVNEITVRPAPAVADDVAPGSVGAAGTPASLSGISPEEEALFRTTAEGQKWLERQEPGVRDSNVYVPGETATMAEVEQTVNAAREAKALGQKHPELAQDALDIAFANNDRRIQHYQGLARSDTDLALAKKARAAQAETDLAETFGNKGEADASGVMSVMANVERHRDWRRSAVRDAVNEVRKEMVDADGNVWTDPEMLYGVRQHIDDMLAKLDAQGNKQHARAESRLMEIKNALDEAIEKAAPGFAKYRENFARASRGIEEMEVLQAAEHKLVDSRTGNMTLARFQNFMRDVIKKRKADGLAPEKSLTDETMAQLWNIRDSLRRSAGAQELARAFGGGSDTNQNLFTRVAGSAVPIGVQLGATLVAPGVGNVAAEMGRQGIMSVIQRRRDASELARGRQLQQNQLGPGAAP